VSRDELSPINCRAIKCRAMKCHGTGFGHFMSLDSMNSVFTARCYAERGYATVSRLSVRLSVCDVDVWFSHSLEFFENNCTAE